MLRQTLVIAGCMLVIVTGCARKNPLVPATPWADIYNDSLCFFAATTDPAGLSLSFAFDWGDGNTSTTGLVPSGETAYSTHVFALSGTHPVKVMARNENGLASNWSAPLMFRSSQPPVVEDTIIGPVRWAVSRWYRASVKVTDPDGDSVSVKFVWGDLPGASWTAFVPSGSVVTDSCLWTATGPHTVRVVVKDQGSMVTRPDIVKTVSLSPVAVLWANDEVDSYTSPALGMAGGQVVVCAVDGRGVWGINADGTTRWKWEREPMSAHYGPSTSADGSRLYVADDNRGVICFDVASGAVIWQLDQQYGDCTPVVGPDGAICVTSGDNVTRIRDLGDSARVEWQFNAGDYDATTVILGSNGMVYAISYGTWEDTPARLRALDSTGSLLWQDTTNVMDYGYYMFGPALDSRGRLVVASGEDSLVCFNPDGSLAWSAEAAGLYGGGLTVGYDDRIYVQSTDYDLIYCLDSDGRMVWASAPPDGAGDYNNVCALADSSIFFVCDEEYAGCLDWSGQVLWDFWIEDSIETGSRSRHRRDEGDDEPTPLVGPDGNIYLTYYDGLCCLAAGNIRLANTAWPTYNHDNARSGWAGRH
jgi:outer membrane protein assembly factor BamB